MINSEGHRSSSSSIIKTGIIKENLSCAGEPTILLSTKNPSPALKNELHLMHDQEVAPDKNTQDAPKCKFGKLERTKSESDVNTNIKLLDLKLNTQSKQSCVQSRVHSSSRLEDKSVCELFDPYKSYNIDKSDCKSEITPQNSLITRSSQESASCSCKCSSRSLKNSYSNLNIIDVPQSEGQKSISNNADVCSLYYNPYEISDSDGESRSIITERSQVKSMSTAVTYCSKSKEKLYMYQNEVEESMQNKAPIKKKRKQVSRDRDQSYNRNRGRSTNSGANPPQIISRTTVKKQVQNDNTFTVTESKRGQISSFDSNTRHYQTRENHAEKVRENQKYFARRTNYNIAKQNIDDSYCDMSDDEHLSCNSTEEINPRHFVHESIALSKHVERFQDCMTIGSGIARKSTKLEVHRTRSDLNNNLSQFEMPRSCMSSATSSNIPVKKIVQHRPKAQSKKKNFKSPPAYQPRTTIYQNYNPNNCDNQDDEYHPGYSYYQQ